MVRGKLIPTLLCFLLLFNTFAASESVVALTYDKVVHFRSFAFMAALLRHFGGVDKRNILLTLGTVGAIDEYVAQYYFTSTIGTEDLDVLADLCGALFGVLSYDLLERRGILHPLREWSRGERYGVDISLGRLAMRDVGGHTGPQMEIKYTFPSGVEVKGEGASFLTAETGESLNVRLLSGRVSTGLTKELGIAVGVIQPTITLPDSSIYRTVYLLSGVDMRQTISSGVRFSAGVDLLYFVPNSVKWWGYKGRDIVEELTPAGVIVGYRSAIEFDVGSRFYGCVAAIKVFTSRPHLLAAVGFHF